MILSLETSTRVCSIALHFENQLIASQSYHIDKSHSSLLPVIVEELLNNSGVNKRDLKAISISEGPGSYTGLRIGTSAAKGLAYGMDIPLISVSTLEVMARAIEGVSEETLILPMIDARRMEVYFASFNHKYELLEPVSSLIIEEGIFSKYLEKRILLVGNGATKCDIISHPDCKIIDWIFPDARQMGSIAWQKFQKGEFENTAYFEPFYLKEFQTKKAKNKLNQ